MNNPEFWLLLDKLIEESEIIIDRPKGTKHPRFDYVYTIDYGYLSNTEAMDKGGIDVWRGSEAEKKCDAVICTVDIMKRDSEIKILLGCTEAEKEAIMECHNRFEFTKGLMFRRNDS